MKTAIAILLAITAFLHAAEKGFVVVPVGEFPQAEPAPVPLLYSVTAAVDARIALDSATSVQTLDFGIHQGKAETLTVSLGGTGEVLSITGDGLSDWSVRVAADGSRFLDLRPAPDATALSVEVSTQTNITNNRAQLLLPGPVAATTGFSLSVTLAAADGVDVAVVANNGLSAVQGADLPAFIGAGAAELEVAVSPVGYVAPELELLDAALTGQLAADGNSVAFQLTATARAKSAGATMKLLDGAALSRAASGDGWHVALAENGYNLIATRAGDIPLTLDFVAPVTRDGDWRALDFHLPAGAVVPVNFSGLPEGISFAPASAIVPERAGEQWRGYLPGDGHAAMSWRPADELAEGAMFFSSSETIDVRIGSGLMRQRSTLDLRVLQGKLTDLSIALDGPGEILSVSGEPVLGWSVTGDGPARQLDVQLSRPIEGAGQFVIEAQAALGEFPSVSPALRMTPRGSLRHGGWLRVANEGAVRIEVADARGLVQLAPAQFPGGAAVDKPRQEFVYRFPSADHSYAIRADQILPEISVTETTVYELAEADRRILTEIELDIREAAVREWEMEIAADLAVVAVRGAPVADHVLASETSGGMRRLKVQFKQPISGRHLLALRLEKNEPAAAGRWDLPPLGFPGVKSRRGYIGAVAAAGYRLAVAESSGVAEVPVTFFPRQAQGLQQAFRLREGVWQVGLTVESLGQSVQADVFHLYSLKTGAAYGSVLINWFVVGAPATEWRVSVPEGLGNIDVTGQNVGRDWRREGDTVVVPLSRPITGAGTLLLTFEQPLGTGGGDLSPGAVRPLDVQAERGYVQVVSPLQVKSAVPVSSGSLLALDPSELPAEFRLLSSAPTIGAWQYTGRDFEIGMKIEWFETGETVARAIDFLSLTSKISREGEWVTDAALFVKSKGQGAMRATLPAGAALWEAKVNGSPVNARADGTATLIPLPTANPNETVEVALRYGAAGGDARHVALAAPVFDAPVVAGEWTVTGDDGRELVPGGGTAELTEHGLAETGWQWLGRNPGPVAALILLALVALLVRPVAWVAALGLAATACFIGYTAIAPHDSGAPLEYAVPVMGAGEKLVLGIGNVAPWQARAGWGFGLLIVLGVGVAARGWLKADRWWKASGIALIAASFLSIRGGAPLFCGLIALAAFASCRLDFRRVLRRFRSPKQAEAVAAVVFLTIIAAGVARGATKPAESMVHDWEIRDGRLRGSIDVTLRGEAGDRFLLLRAPAVLGDFQGNGLRVVLERGVQNPGYFLVAEETGEWTGRAVFEMPLPDPQQGWELPSGPAAMRKVNVRWDQPGWEFLSAGAAEITPLAGEGSGAAIVLGPGDPVNLSARPKQRDAATEPVRFFAEVANLYLPGPGVVNGRHRVSIRPAQGRVAALVIQVPEGLMVGNVSDGPGGTWRFDPEKRELRVPVEPASEEPFSLIIETQRGAESLPTDLALVPLRVLGSAGETGFLALAFDGDAQPESIEADGMSRVNPEDFDAALLSEGGSATLQNAFRYGAGDALLKVRVAPVEPELRAEFHQLVSLGEDRLVVAGDLAVSITRAGVFRLEVDIPPELEIETATGEGLSHWTESTAGAAKLVTLHLAERTAGVRKFSLTLTGRPPETQGVWQVPRLAVRGATRETGIVTIVPGRGLQVGAAERRNVSRIDPQALAETSKAAARPGALTFRALQGDWALGLAIDRLDPWVTARVLHDATLREGQVIARVSVAWKIENAAVKSLRVRIPGLDAAATTTVRGSGPAVADVVAVEGEPDLWEVRFERGMAGDAQVDLEYQRTGDGGGETIVPVIPEGVRQLEYFAALRAGGRLEIDAGPLPAGWRRTDWAVVRSELGRMAGSIAPTLAFRVADPAVTLPVVLKRHQLAGIEKLRVAAGDLTTVLAPDGTALTSADLKLEIAGKNTMRLKLPDGAALFNVTVNGEDAALVREGERWLFHVFPHAESAEPAGVHFTYSVPAAAGGRLEGPVLDVPLENLTWRVLVPEGWRLAGHDGDFELKSSSPAGEFGLEEYRALARVRQENGSIDAARLLDRAGTWMREGDQQKASQAYTNAVRSNLLDAASGEDARVQLRQLKTQQAVLGLNTRRQKLAIDNRGANSDARLDRAVEANPVMRGGSNFDPRQFDRFLEGNTADENAALKEIAARIVAQQLAAGPAPAALDVALPERGQVHVFSRSVQVDGTRPMALTLDVKRAGNGFIWPAALLCLLAGAVAVARSVRRG